MKNLLLKIKNLWFELVTLKRYQKNSYIFGTMLSYSYMGEPVGFKSRQKKNEKFIKLLFKKNLKPWDYNELASFGWGKEPSPIREFKSNEEKEMWLSENESYKKIIMQEQKQNFAQVLANKFFN